MENTTTIIRSASDGDKDAQSELFVRTHDMLKRIALAERNRWQGNLTMNATALVNEAYLKLSDGQALNINDRSHFLAIAGRAMRQVLQDYAKAAKTSKRGGEVQKVSLELDENVSPAGSGMEEAELMDISHALEELDKTYPDLVKIIECRFFGGMTIEETSLALEIGTTTVKRRWLLAQAMLFDMLSEEG